MAVNLNPNLKKAGLTGGLKTGTGISKKNVAMNLKSNAAHSASLFSLKSGGRSNFVSGQFVTKGLNNAKYHNAYITSHNRNWSPSSSGISSSYSNLYTNGMSAQQYTTSNFLNSAQMGMQIGSQIFSMMNNIGLFNTNSSSGTGSASQSLDNAMSSLTGGGSVSDSSGYISKMSSCQDSVSLRGSISEAKSELTNMQGSLGTYEEASTNAQNNMETFENNVKTAESGLKEAKQNVSTATNTVNAREQNRDNCLNKVSKADAAYGKKETAYAQAHDAHTTATAKLQSATAAVSQAKATLASTPEKIEIDGVQVDNPAYKTAKAELEQANQAEQKAKQAETKAADAEEKAQTEKEEAYNNLQETKAAVDTAKEELETAQEQLDDAKEKQKDAETAQNEANEKYNDAKTQLESAESAVEQYKTQQKNIEKLKKAIKKQEERLAKLEKNEQKNYNKYNQKAQKGIDKNNTLNALQFSGTQGKNSSGGNEINEIDTRKENRLSDRMERTNDKTKQSQARRNAYQSSVDEKAYIDDKLKNSAANFTVSGQHYRKITTPSGQTLYYRDNQMISEEEYNQIETGGAGL